MEIEIGKKPRLHTESLLRILAMRAINGNLSLKKEFSLIAIKGSINPDELIKTISQEYFLKLIDKGKSSFAYYDLSKIDFSKIPAPKVPQISRIDSPIQNFPKDPSQLQVIEQETIQYHSNIKKDLSGFVFLRSIISKIETPIETPKKLDHTNFYSADLRFAIVQNADLHKSAFTRVDCSYADFQKSILDGSSITNGIFINSNFNSASLVNSSIGSSNFSGATMQNADLHKSAFTEVDCSGADFQKSILDESSITNGIFINVNFNSANLVNSSISSSNFSGAILTKCNMFQCDLNGTQFSNADLSGASFANSYLGGSDFSGATLSNAILLNANIYGANFNNAILTNVNFDRTLEKTLKSYDPNYGDNIEILSQSIILLLENKTLTHAQKKQILTIDEKKPENSILKKLANTIKEITPDTDNKTLIEKHKDFYNLFEKKITEIIEEEKLIKPNTTRVSDQTIPNSSSQRPSSQSSAQRLSSESLTQGSL